MWRVLGTILVVCSVATAVGATPMASGEILGTWGNVDTLATGLARVKIVFSDTGSLSVLGYGVCDPAFCEWGATSLVLVGMRPEFEPEWAVAIWDLAPTVIVMILSREGPLLVAELFGYNTDGTGLPYREIVLLRRIE
jgi:hypothetical protein